MNIREALAEWLDPRVNEIIGQLEDRVADLEKQLADSLATMQAKLDAQATHLAATNSGQANPPVTGS